MVKSSSTSINSSSEAVKVDAEGNAAARADANTAATRSTAGQGSHGAEESLRAGKQVESGPKGL